MNRVDFMNQLESLLQSISSTEREEAIQYYNDYFDDAGEENEQEVIEALGNPARVAENIKRDLAGNGYGEGFAQKVKASDRVLMEYGKNIPEDSEDTQDSEEKPVTGQTGPGTAGNASDGYGQGSRESSGTYSSQSSPFEDYGSGSRYTSGTGSSGTWEQNGTGYTPEKRKKGEGMPVWAIAMLITVLVLASPVLGAVALGALGILVGGLAGWFGLIFGFGATAVVLLVLMLVLVIVGIICFFVSPWVGIALVGGGLICGSIGLVFLMLTVAMAGIATPAVCRGIGFVFRGFKRKRALAN
ncbi:MAG TPA: hypothetical protein DCZ91_20760 [Lachnospiraceae bacterium]|nr:hypothetical protein [Lachnospiraceae bacterium]